MNETESKTPTTGLILFTFNGSYCESYARSCWLDASRKITNLPHLNVKLGYGFNFQMPAVVVQDTEEEYLTEKGWFSKGGQKETRVIQSDVILKFATPITDEELKFWRIFKLGYVSKTITPRV